MAHIFLALGSNVGDKKDNIQKAFDFLSEKISNIKMASIYESKAMYYQNQDDFLNTVIEGYTDLSLDELLNFTQNVESRVGRVFRFKNGPREIDIDILFYDDNINSDSRITVPHPLIQERDFVLSPLSELAPDFVHPVLKIKIIDLLHEYKNNKNKNL